MGRIAEKVGTRWTVIFGSLMIGRWSRDLDAGAALATVDRPRDFHRADRTRRHQRADVHLREPVVRPPPRLRLWRLISSGSYLAGAMWPPMFERAIANFGWRETMLWYAHRRGRRNHSAGGDLFSCAAGTHSPAAATARSAAGNRHACSGGRRIWYSA